MVVTRSLKLMLRIHEINPSTIPETTFNSLFLQFSTEIVTIMKEYLELPIQSRCRSTLARIFKSIATINYPSIALQLSDWFTQFASASLEQSVDLTICILFLMRESRFLSFWRSLEHNVSSVLQSLEQLATPSPFENISIEKFFLYLLIVCREADVISENEDLTLEAENEAESSNVSDEARAAQFESQSLFSRLNSLVSTLYDTDLLPSAFATIVRRIPQTSLTSKHRVFLSLDSLIDSHPCPISRRSCC